MQHSRILVLAVTGAALALTAACNPFRSPFKQAPVVEVSTEDANANARWNGTLASPANLAGAVQMTGSATMTPGTNGNNTNVTVKLANASPGGEHPWQVRQGQCGSDYGVFGTGESYRTLKVDDDGRAASTATLGLTMPQAGQYYVSVGASSANAGTIVACGNLAAPAR
jgi:hypothetical protein